MGRKKSFLNKKNAATFRLVCRDSSASDPFGLSANSDKVFTRVDNGTNYVPGFTDDNPITRQQSNSEDHDSIFADAEEEDDDSDKESNGKSVGKPRSIPKSNTNPYIVGQGPLPDYVRREILELGLPDDGYNYLAHMREIRISGAGSSFVPNPKANPSSLPADVKAYDASQLQVQAHNEDDTSSNALYSLGSRIRHIRNVKKAADPDILAHLEKSDGSEFDSDEILDEDFIIQANKPEEEVEGESSMRTPEIKQEHLQGIEPSTGQDNHAASSLKKCFDATSQILTDVTENGALQGSEKQRIPRLLDEQFELLALREYSDGENDAYDAFDYDTMGAVDIHAPEIDHAMKEFLTNNLDFQDKYTVPADLRSYTNTENSNKNHKGAKLHDFPESESQKATVDDVIRKCAEYAEMYENESQEENEIVLVEESSSDDEVWDCETIISTYSNLDNHPAKIGAPHKPAKKNISEISSRNKEMHEAVIPLRGRQQLPVDFLPNTGNSRKKEAKSRSEIDSKNMVHARVEETLEQKKARKQSVVKEEKREARRVKKEFKALYRGESQRAQHVAAVAGPPGIHLM